MSARWEWLIVATIVSLLIVSVLQRVTIDRHEDRLDALECAVLEECE